MRLTLASAILSSIIVALAMVSGARSAEIPAAALHYRADLTREAKFIFGLNAPIPTLAAQIEQESGWRPGITAWDNGRGLAQFMDGTAAWAADRFADLGPADPYNPRWAMRAMVRLDDFNARKVAGIDLCHRWGAGLKAYNAGLGYVTRAQKRSQEPAKWFGATELINAGQSDKNFEYSRMYPRWIMGKRQPKYAAWGTNICKEIPQ